MTDTINEARALARGLLATGNPLVAKMVEDVADECERLRADLEAARAELARVTAERDAAQASAKHWKYHADKWADVRDRQIEYRDAAIRCAEAAEAELAAARAAMPTMEVQRLLAFAVRHVNLSRSERSEINAWLDRLAAYHAAHPAASSDGTGRAGGEEVENA